MPLALHAPYSAARSQAVGRIGREILAQCHGCRQRLRQSISVGRGMLGVQRAICETSAECSRPEWDGGSAQAVTAESLGLAQRFLDTLPLGTVAPSVGVEPDGQLTLEWHAGPHWTLSISVDPKGDLLYAALLGSRWVCGTEPFFGEVPRCLLRLIHEVSRER